MSEGSHLKADRRGETALGYGLLFALMAIVIVSIARGLMLNLKATFLALASQV